MKIFLRGCLAVNLFLALFIASQAYAGGEPVILTLDEALSIALRDNRDVLLKAEDVQKAKAKIAEANAGLMPTLTTTGSWTDTRGLYAKDTAQTTTQTTLKQYLFKGSRTINTIKQNKDKFEVSQAILDKTKLELALNVKKAFYTLLLSREFADLNKGILDNTRQHFDAIKARYNNGEVSASDTLKIQSSLDAVIQAYEASLNQMELGLSILRNLLYLNDEVNVQLDAQFVYEKRELAYAAAFLKATQSRPEIRQYEAQERADTRAIDIAKADTRPSIYGSWDYYSRSHLSATTARNWNDYNVIGLTFSWPIFDGWAAKAKVEQAIIDLKETRLLKEKTIKDVALEVKNSYLSLKTAIEEIKAAESDLVVYRDNLKSLEEKYSQGIASLLDKGDAGLQYEVALFNQKQAIYDYVIAQSSFDKATGG